MYNNLNSLNKCSLMSHSKSHGLLKSKLRFCDNLLCTTQCTRKSCFYMTKNVYVGTTSS